jgi:imidazolonepropionase-like amidohydrolase
LAGGAIFDGRSPPIEGHGLLIEGSAIRRLAPVAEFEGYSGKIFNTDGCLVMPGLIDCHVHLSLGAEEDVTVRLAELTQAEICLRILENCQSALLGGVVAVRDLGGRDWLEMGVRRAFHEDRHLGPTIRSAGKVVCMTGGHAAWVGIEADGVDEVVKAVRTNIKAGADCIKVMATGGVLTPGVDPLAEHLTSEELTAAVRTAHALGRKVASHAQGSGGIRNAVLAGVDSIEHGFQLTDEVIELMVERGTYLVPTLTATAKLIEDPDRLPAHVRDKALRYAEMHFDSFSRYVAAGGRVAFGTDAGTPFNYFGANAQELKALVDRGLTPLDALRTATSNAADLLDLPENGHLAEGAAADLLVIEGDPLADIERAANPAHFRLILKNGHDVRAILRDAARRPASAIPTGMASSWSGCSCFLG